MMSTDEELVARSKTGDTESFNQLVKRWERPIFALAYRTLGREEDARDVTQETFLRAFRALGIQRGREVFVVALSHRAQPLPRLDPQGPPHAGRRRARGGRNGAARRRSAGPPRPSKTSPRAPSSAAVVEHAMERLPAEQRQAIILKEYHGLTFQEIADLMKCPLSTVKTRVYQGLSTLAKRTRGHEMMHIADNQDALLDYLYDEGDPAERLAIATHLQECATLLGGGARAADRAGDVDGVEAAGGPARLPHRARCREFAEREPGSASARWLVVGSSTASSTKLGASGRRRAAVRRGHGGVAAAGGLRRWRADGAHGTRGAGCAGGAERVDSVARAATPVAVPEAATRVRERSGCDRAVAAARARDDRCRARPVSSASWRFGCRRSRAKSTRSIRPICCGSSRTSDSSRK